MQVHLLHRAAQPFARVGLLLLRSPLEFRVHDEAERGVEVAGVAVPAPGDVGVRCLGQAPRLVQVIHTHLAERLLVRRIAVIAFGVPVRDRDEGLCAGAQHPEEFVEEVHALEALAEVGEVLEKVARVGLIDTLVRKRPALGADVEHVVHPRHDVLVEADEAFLLLAAAADVDLHGVFSPLPAEMPGPVMPSTPRPASAVRSASLPTPSAITFRPIECASVHTPRTKTWLPALASMSRMKAALTLM